MELSRLLPWRRRALNGAMIAAIHRQAEATRALVDATRHFQSHVVWYGQTVAAFSRNQRHHDGSEDIESIQRAFNAIAADWQQHWDALDTREQRYDARTAALTHAYDELREIVGLAQQSTLSLKRAVETLQTAGPAAGQPRPPATRRSPPAAAPSTDGARHERLQVSWRSKIGSADRATTSARGCSTTCRCSRARATCLTWAAAAASCSSCSGSGRSMRAASTSNDAMVEACRDRGLVADRADALTFVSAQPDASLGGLIAIQVVEHLEPAYLMQLIEAAFHKLRPGAPLVLETINAACWTAFFDSYIRDFTHVRPLHPDTLRYLVQASGFATAEIRFRAPVAEHDKLPLVKVPAPAVPETPASTDAAIRDLAEAINGHAERLNSRLFTYRDFAVVARR